MGNPWQAHSFAQASAVNVPNGATTTIVTGGQVTTSNPADQVTIDAYATITPGTGTTALVVSIVRVIGGQTVKTVTIPCAAGTNRTVNLRAQNTPGLVDGESYKLTVNPTGATAAGTVTDTVIETWN